MVFVNLSYLNTNGEKNRGTEVPRCYLVLSINQLQVLEVPQEWTQQQRGRVGSCERYARA